MVIAFPENGELEAAVHKNRVNEPTPWLAVTGNTLARRTRRNKGDDAILIDALNLTNALEGRTMEQPATIGLLYPMGNG